MEVLFLSLTFSTLSLHSISSLVFFTVLLDFFFDDFLILSSKSLSPNTSLISLSSGGFGGEAGDETFSSIILEDSSTVIVVEEFNSVLSELSCAAVSLIIFGSTILSSDLAIHTLSSTEAKFV